MPEWPFPRPLTPMEAKVQETCPGATGPTSPSGTGSSPWPGAGGALDSRNHRPLLRYFPELEAPLRALPPGTVVDGEVVVVRGDRLDFDAL